MFHWLPVILISYFFFSLSSFGDKLILRGPIKPKLYTFYVGVFGLFVLLALPFISFTAISIETLFLAISTGVAFTLGLYCMYYALERFEASKVIPVIGAVQPIVLLLLSAVFFGYSITEMNLIAFIVLLFGSIVVSFENHFRVSIVFLKYTFLSAIFFSMDYLILKLIFLQQPFLQGLLITRLAIFLAVTPLLFSRKFRKEIFSSKNVLNKKTGALFLGTQTAGGIAVFLQSFAISLVPAASLAILNALRGAQYVFLFMITLFFSFFFPKILREKILLSTLLKKGVGIGCIVLGIVLLVI